MTRKQKSTMSSEAPFSLGKRTRRKIDDALIQMMRIESISIQLSIDLSLKLNVKLKCEKKDYLPQIVVWVETEIVEPWLV
jgi:hypothetical protein